MIPLTVAVRSWQNSPTSQRPSTSQAPKDRSSWLGREARSAVRMAMASEGGRPSKKNCRSITNMAMDQYLYIPFLGGWTSIYQLFWCSPGVQGFDPTAIFVSPFFLWPHGGLKCLKKFKLMWPCHDPRSKSYGVATSLSRSFAFMIQQQTEFV